MTFTHNWTILVKQWKIIVICFIVTGLGSFIGSELMTPIYQSSVLVEIAVRSVNSQQDYSSLLASDQLVQTEAQLAVSDPVLRAVASHYPGMTVENLIKHVTVTPKLNTQLFEIDVLDSSPVRAAAIANDVAATLIKQQLLVRQQDDALAQQQVQQDLINTQERINSVAAQISALQAKGGKQPRISVLQVQLNGLQTHYNQWQTLLAQLELTQAQNGDFLRVAQPAQPGLTPVRPNIPLNTGGGLLAGLFLGILLVLLFAQLDTRVRSSEMLSQLVDWPVLATVWRLDFSKKDKQAKEGLVNPPQRSANIESYRILRTNIGFSMIDKPLRSLVVTSAVPQEGKSVVAANLAIFMAKTGKNTLLIDADLRRPTVHEKFNLSADKMGLSNAVLACSQLQFVTAAPSESRTADPKTLIPVFNGQVEEAEKTRILNRQRVHQTPEPGQEGLVERKSMPLPSNFSIDPFIHAVGIPNLRVMPSGPLPPNPPELLDSKAMEHLLMVLASCGAEVVIIDTPPLISLSDTSILARKVDGTVIVVDITQANKKSVMQTKKLLEQAGTRVLGCVVNKQRHGRKDTAYYYYYRVEERPNKGNHRVKNANGALASLPPEHRSSFEGSGSLKNGDESSAALTPRLPQAPSSSEQGRPSK